MDKPLLIKSVLMFISLWAIGILFLWFRRNIEIFWKIVATLILAFYVWFFYEELYSGYLSFSNDWYNSTITFLKELVAIIFTNLFFLWPLALIIIFYKADDIKAENLLKFMCVFTLILWIIFVIYIFHNKGVDTFLYENLKKMIPYAK